MAKISNPFHELAPDRSGKLFA